MDFTELAEKYFGDHKNTVIKTNSFGLKLHTTPLSEEEEERKESCLQSIKLALKRDRVERRSARAVAARSAQESTAKVAKTTGFLTNFGLHNKNGKFLNALEANKLELHVNHVPVSIQEGFRMIKDFNKYSAYKKLGLQGYRIRFQQGKKEMKRKISNEEGPSTKARKIEEVEHTSEMQNIFVKLREDGPKRYNPEENYSQSIDFYVKPPGENAELGLVIEKNKEYISRNEDFESKNIYALCSDNEVSFFKLVNTNIPNL